MSLLLGNCYMCGTEIHTGGGILLPGDVDVAIDESICPSCGTKWPVRVEPVQLIKTQVVEPVQSFALELPVKMDNYELIRINENIKEVLAMNKIEPISDDDRPMINITNGLCADIWRLLQEIMRLKNA